MLEWPAALAHAWLNTFVASRSKETPQVTFPITYWPAFCLCWSALCRSTSCPVISLMLCVVALGADLRAGITLPSSQSTGSSGRRSTTPPVPPDANSSALQQHSPGVLSRMRSVGGGKGSKWLNYCVGCSWVPEYGLAEMAGNKCTELKWQVHRVSSIQANHCHYLEPVIRSGHIVLQV